MRKYAFEQFCIRTEEKVRKTINADGIEKAQEELLRAICDADDIFTSRQIRRLLAFAFHI